MENNTSELLEGISNFVEWVFENYSHVKGGYRHRGDFYANDKPVTLRKLFTIYGNKINEQH